MKVSYPFAFENQVLSLIKSKYENVEFECSTGLYSVDMLFTGYNLVIEIDGSSHYYNLT
jgi:very-short-patch-repair endonuclease